MDLIATSTAWLAACAAAAKTILEGKPDAVRDGVRLVFDMPSWGHVPDLHHIYRRGRQIIYDAISNLERRDRFKGINGAVDRRLDEMTKLVRRALALHRL